MDKAKKKRLKQYIAWISLAALVALLAVMPLLARSEQEEEGPVASILEGSVQMGDLETGLHGGGTLSSDTSMNVKLPSGVKITEFLVKNGDTVAEGDPVAAVDKVSVMTSIVQVRDTLEYLQEEMADAKDESVSSSVKATAGGRIKQVFAEPGDSVQDVMLEHGALAVLSLDDRMAVKLEKDMPLAAGDSVRVTFPDDTEITGRVESNLDGFIVVTVEDKNYDVGQQVAVFNEAGETIGTGELYVHNAWKAMAFSGTVSSVSARENTDAYAGSTLMTLKETDFTGTLEGLAGLHREYEDLLQDLFQMHESGVITAPCGGLVSGVDTESEFLLSAIEGEEGWFVDLLTADTEEPGWTVMLLSNVEVTCTGDESCKADKGEHEDGCPMQCTDKEGCTAKEHNTGCAVYCTGLPDCANENHKTGCMGVCTGNDLCQSTRKHKYHEVTCVKRCISDLDEDPMTACDAEVHYEACIENCISNEECTALTHKEDCHFHGVVYTAMAARVSLVSLEGLLVIPGTTTYQVAPEGSGWKLVTPDKVTDVFVGDPQPLTAENAAQFQAGDILLVVTGTNSAGQTVYQKTVLHERPPQPQQPEQTPTLPGGEYPGNLGDILSAMGGMGGKGSFGGFGMTQGTEFELFDLEGDILMTVTEQDAMTLTITVDEQDIAKVALGQRAQVKVNALKGRSFDAEVTKIGASGTNNGGSSKFSVELTMDFAPDMIAGMSAAAYIPLYTKKNVLTVPVAALVEEGGRSLICTALDGETGEPVSAVEVELGISDGINAEVLSGMDSGDVFYYKYYDTLELSTEVEKDRFSFG